MIISTHTPLAGRDEIRNFIVSLQLDFYSHAPCGARREYIRGWFIERISTHTPLAGRDVCLVSDFLSIIRFLLTRPLRGATQFLQKWIDDNSISTHTPLAGRDYKHPCTCDRSAISTHTPLAGRDRSSECYHFRSKQFLLTRPLRGATGNVASGFSTK